MMPIPTESAVLSLQSSNFITSGFMSHSTFIITKN
jgi:hypothetical protein